MDFVVRLDDGAGGDKASTAVVVLIVALVILIPLGVLAGFVAVGVLVVRSVRGHKRTRAQEMEDLRKTVRDDLIALGEDIRALELDLQMPGANAEAQRAYASAVEAYDRANRSWETARTPRDFKPAAEELEEGRYAMLWAREVLAGRTPPERRAPCFFDPRHGPSSRDVSWCPPGGNRGPCRRARPTPSASTAARSRRPATSSATAIASRSTRPARPSRRSTPASSRAC